MTKLYVVTNEDSLYHWCVGELLSKNSHILRLKLKDDTVLFEHSEVEQIL